MLLIKFQVIATFVIPVLCTTLKYNYAFPPLKTRVFVTHGVTFLPQVDQIITVKDGEISEIGAYKELIQRNGAFAEFIRMYLDNAEDEQEGDEDPEGTSSS